jgi:hypothetical protein
VASASADVAGDDLVLAVAHTSASVHEVTARFPGGGVDRMAPVKRWSVLAQRAGSRQSLGAGAAGAVTLFARSGSGATLERVKLPSTGSLGSATGGTCRYWIPTPLPLSSSSRSAPTAAKPG